MTERKKFDSLFLTPRINWQWQSSSDKSSDVTLAEVWNIEIFVAYNSCCET